MSTSFEFEEFDFSGAMRDLSQGLLVKPVLHTYLYDARFPEFDLHFRKEDMGERKPDGWFHPSTHPEMHPRVLYQYLAHPQTFPVEKKKYMGTLAVTLGKIAHEFVQTCLTDAGIMTGHEVPVVDEELGERGSLDGLLAFPGIPNVPEEKAEPAFEFKTSHDNFGRLSKIEDLDLVAFRKKWPDYYGQQQRYLRMSRRRTSIVLMMEMSYPFAMKEFHIPYDLGYNAQVDTKYRTVRQAVADGRPPLCCGFRGCLSALPCGVVR